MLTFGKNELDLVLIMDQVKDGDNDNDWMTRLLLSRLFELIPPANIHTLVINFI
jgi:hypothetical protein